MGEIKRYLEKTSKRFQISNRRSAQRHLRKDEALTINSYLEEVAEIMKIQAKCWIPEGLHVIRNEDDVWGSTTPAGVEDAEI